MAASRKGGLKVLIGELSKETGLSKDTIRFYEKRKLISSAKKANNYKTYSKETVDILTFITRAKKLGFTLNEIKELIEISSSDNNRCLASMSKVQKRIEDIDNTMKVLEEQRSNLQQLLKECPGPDFCAGMGPNRNR